MPAPFPQRYSATVCRTSASRARIEAPPRPGLRSGALPTRDDDVDARSPEHMVLASLGLSLLATFEGFAARDGIDLLAWRADTSGTVEQSIDGPTFTSIVIELDVEIAGSVDCFEDALEDAKRYCLVLNALRVPVVVETTVRTPYDAAVDLADLAEITELRPRPRELLQAV
jgi:organic hydroperoxide reductase OsmC/OhrA